MYAARGTERGGIVLVRGAGLAFAEWRPFLASLIFAGLGGALLAALASYLLARRLTRPIAALSDATAQVATGDEPVDVPVTGDDELAQLGQSFNLMSHEPGARARDQQRRLPGVRQPRAEDAADLDPRVRRGTRRRCRRADQASEVIGAEADRLERLVSDLLDLARLRRAGFSVERVPLDLARVVDRAVERHRLRAAELGIALTANHDAPAPAVGDPDRPTAGDLEPDRERAPAHARPRGAVTVTARPGEIDGAGHRAGARGRRTCPAPSSASTCTSATAASASVGSGLGLAIVGELAAAMGGSITVENVPSGGARFTLLVPQS